MDGGKDLVKNAAQGGETCCQVPKLPDSSSDMTAENSDVSTFQAGCLTHSALTKHGVQPLCRIKHALKHENAPCWTCLAHF